MLDNSCICALLCITEPSSLPHNCVLDRILHVQTLDQMDIEEIHPLYVKVKEHLASHPQDRWVQISLISILIIFFSWFLFSEHFLSSLLLISIILKNEIKNKLYLFLFGEFNFYVGDKKRFSFKVLIYVITEQLGKLYQSKYLMYSNAWILD